MCVPERQRRVSGRLCFHVSLCRIEIQVIIDYLLKIISPPRIPYASLTYDLSNLGIRTPNDSSVDDSSEPKEHFAFWYSLQIRISHAVCCRSSRSIEHISYADSSFSRTAFSKRLSSCAAPTVAPVEISTLHLGRVRSRTKDNINLLKAQ